ncbi:helicase-related protein [Sedimentibacter saalensis]|uniref:SNF2 domain-containing protein n=1 Tax=Sedimentibacter saalensis TaxID=130788 RepID=A0A562JBF1_9FIRM|nr:helicase-related protein [Sedimentibacter saalensis]TWH80393.1 SNF2 domain-containing protein [Sedimentibacter saalensis]
MDVKELNNIFDLSKKTDSITASLQTKTCAVLINMLENSPGMILGDDVGMGKTYVAIATAAYYLTKNPEKSIIIITPSWQLNAKWYKELNKFLEVNLININYPFNPNDIKTIKGDYLSYIQEIKEKSKVAKIILIPVNVFVSIGWKNEKSFFLSCWFKHRRLWGTTREKVLKALGGNENIKSPTDFYDIGISYEDMDESWYENLDKANISGKSIDDDTVSYIWEELKELRYKAINSVLPDASLLILDEAHNMKNENTVRRQSLERVIYNKFDKAIFLTATPFQLSVSELKSVMRLFEAGKSPMELKQKFQQNINLMFTEMQKYIALTSEFQCFVGRLTEADNYILEKMICGENVKGINIDIENTYKLYLSVYEQKVNLENVMKNVIIRNVKKKDKYRNEVIGALNSEERTGIPLFKDSLIPFAMAEKAIFELMKRGDQTFIANAKQTLTSSYSSSVNSSLYKLEDLPSLNILKKMDIEKLDHPKINSVVDEVVENLNNGNKTLIFCNRIKTVEELEKRISEHLDKNYNKDIKRLFQDNTEKSFENYYKRFYNKNDISWILLQESYINSVLIPVIKLCGGKNNILPKAQSIKDSVTRLYLRYNRSVKANYMYLKRIVEHLVFKEVLSKFKWKKVVYDFSTDLFDTVSNILNENYIENGIYLTNDDAADEKYDNTDENEIRNISISVINKIITFNGIWDRYSDKLNMLNPSERYSLVSAMIGFLRVDKRFLIELRNNMVKNPNRSDNFCLNKTFRKRNILDWESAYGRFIEKYISTESETARKEMILGLKSTKIVDKCTGETTNERREKIMAGFNTPFNPKVLIATSTMSEGIDLQEECKRVIHYDLEWNPASLEQRVGRIDRINSLISKLQVNDGRETLDVFYPYIKNTIDESIYRTVKDREKWFNLILGGTPQWDTFEIDPEITSISPNVFKQIQIDLGVGLVK